ncbi:hypothetical protein TCAL_15679 [Tigriopus californicus]|uniref:Uncharacterized protein n=1 Tax=Tigriopus californicus TaxID=6832 RepID=A0A553PA45_TIGCA|nr:hypothetical protein TCAL_15679 [Tigriopus californicus]
MVQKLVEFLGLVVIQGLVMIQGLVVIHGLVVITPRRDPGPRHDLGTSGSNLKLELTHDSPDGEVVVTKELVAHPAEKLVLYVRDNLVGNNEIVRCDYMQNWRILKFIEDHLAKEVAPYLTNDPSTTTVTGLQSTMYFDEVKYEIQCIGITFFEHLNKTNIIRKATNASNGDELFFIPSGSSPKDQNSKVIRHFIEMTKLFSPIVLTSVQIDSKVMVLWSKPGEMSLLFQKKIMVPLICDTLKEILVRIDPLLVFLKAMSDITGVISEDLEITALCHSLEQWFYGITQRRDQMVQLSCWDLLAIVRTGMALQLKQAVTAQFIVERQVRFNAIITEKLSKVSNLFHLGSLKMDQGEMSCHLWVQHNLTGEEKYIPCMMNALDHSYAKRIFNIDKKLRVPFSCRGKTWKEENRFKSFSLDIPKSAYLGCWLSKKLSNDWKYLAIRLNFVTNAIELVCRKGWILLPQYIFMRQTGEWHHQINLAFCDRKCLTNITYENGVNRFPNGTSSVFVLNDAILKAKETFGNAKRQNQGFKVPDCTALFSEAAQQCDGSFCHPKPGSDVSIQEIYPNRLASTIFATVQHMVFICNSNSIGTLGGNAEFSNDLSNETRESRKPLERGYWLKHCKSKNLVRTSLKLPLRNHQSTK